MLMRLVILRRFALCLLVGGFVWLTLARHFVPPVIAAKAVVQTGCENFELSPPVQAVPARFKIEFARDLNNDGWLDLGVVNEAAQLAIWYGETGGLSFRQSAP